MNSVPETAHSFSQALNLGAVTLESIIQWADEMIVSESEPSIEFIELALCKNKSDALSFLNTIALGADEELSYRKLFGLLYDALLQKRVSYIDVAKRLFYWSAYETDLKGYGELIGYWDDIDLARSGIHGDLKSIKENLLNFLHDKKA